jgi:uncharacterized protein (UPF0147 family)
MRSVDLAVVLMVPQRVEKMDKLLDEIMADQKVEKLVEKMADQKVQKLVEKMADQKVEKLVA